MDITNTVSRNSSGRPLSELKFYTGDDGTTTGLRNNDRKFLSVNVPRPNKNSQNVSEWGTLMTIPQPCANYSPTECDYEPFAVHCEIFPCVKTYGANITNRILTEDVITTTRMLTTNSTDNFTLTTNSTLRNILDKNRNSVGLQYRDCNPSIEPDRVRPVAIIVDPTATPPIYKYYPPDCVYTFGAEARDGMQRYLTTLFTDGPLFNFVETWSKHHLRRSMVAQLLS